MLLQLPDDVLHAVLLRLAAPRDLVRAGRAAWRCWDLSEEGRVWRALCKHHFTPRQWGEACPPGRDVEEAAGGWKQLFIRLYK